MKIRLEQPDDQPGIYAVEQAAFGRPDEADLVDKVRSAYPEAFSLVAVESDRIVGHVLFSPMRIEPGKPGLRAAALGPLAVHPDVQCKGIGTALSEAGLEECRCRGYDLAFVLGHPNYYPRFGFRPSKPLGLVCEYPVSEEAFMVVELTAGALEGCQGTVYYVPEFAGE